MVRAAYIEFNSSLPFFVALDKGLFRRNGIQVTAIKAATANEAVNVVIAGQADVAIGCAYSMLFPAAVKEPNSFRFFLTYCETERDFTSHLLVRADSDIQSISDYGRRLHHDKRELASSQ